MPHHHADLVMGHYPVRREVIPSKRLPLLLPTSTVLGSGLPTLVARAPSSDSTDSSTCSSGSNCEKPTSNLTTTVLPVVLGAGVPILCAIVVLIILHRRHVKKLMREDANDKHKSLDFGLDEVGPASGRKGPNGMPQMTEPGHGKGMSLDIHPYLMPPEIHGSRDSLHSLSRSIDDDKYRPATFIPHDGASIRSFPRTRDDASSLAGSSTRFGGAEEPNSGLLRNAQRMSRSSPPLHRSPSGDPQAHPARPPQDHGPHPRRTPAPSEHDPHGLAIGSATTDVGRNVNQSAPSEPQINLNSTSSLQFETEVLNDDYTSATHQDRPNFPLPDPAQSHGEIEHSQASNMQLPRISLPASDVTSDYGDERRSELMIPAVNIHGAETEQYDIPSNANKLSELPEEPQNLDLAFENPRDTRRLTLGVRPLPPEDPLDNPEQRANRIRSFYKEYFDDSKRETTYYEDYGPEFYEGGYVYDPATGDYFDAAPHAPFAEPVGRRAMTPPPRAPPRFQGAARHMATNSAGFSGYRAGPRAFSSASGRLPGPRGPRKPMPPPAPLQILPTPHMLKDDSIMLAADFAPGKSFRDQREGRPETPTGGTRAYSPATRAHTPLVSAFDELAAIPSAHALRKSGTYTSLDFAPPPRFKNSDSGSDAGSIRSNRTGISNTHMNNIRMGNYRVSRLPADMVGTKDDLMSSLRPNMDMGR
ncbi:uncharacterized protein N7459_009819 [Penicillium hispanicum]|uniref:uncharacterized protein n=1 Tax=Penicillium hispanicum TaxID=1080232 RepID=UPI002540760C|nr:uncharacterized protein N7459_009819 [Penicillium hispanicum]KAJ5570389.1 hypothetical protein N7459_009819 [Penicillium hispanicum]